MSTPIYIMALHAQGKIFPETYEVVSFAREIGSSQKTIVVLGTEQVLPGLTRELAERTGIDVLGVAGEYLEHYCAESYTAILKEILGRSAPLTLCIPHIAMGYDFAPSLAAAMHASCITAVEDVHEGAYVRAVFSGKIRAHIRLNTPSAVMTVLPGAWNPCTGESSSKARVTIVYADNPPVSTRTHGLKASSPVDISFADADVIVSAGRGIGHPQNLSHIKDLAALFPKSAIGATRAVCDLGWMSYRHQIGSTGTSVSPKVYIACGISGAIQHMSGMRNSGVIIAINTDPYAAIFRYATYCIVEDVNTFIPVLIEEYRK